MTVDIHPRSTAATKGPALARRRPSPQTRRRPAAAAGRAALFGIVTLLMTVGIVSLWQGYRDFSAPDPSLVEVSHRFADRPVTGVASAPRDRTLVFSFAVSPGELLKFLESVTPRLRGIAHGLGRELRLEIADGEGEVVRQVESGLADVGAVSAVTYVKHRRKTAIQALLERIGDGDKRTLILVKEDHPASRLEDLRGARIAFRSRDSLSGYRFPLREVRARGLDPKVLFAEEAFTGNMRNSLTGILAGRYDAAAVSSTFFLEQEAEFRGRFRVILETPPLPGGVYLAHASASAALTGDLFRQFRAVASTLQPREQMSGWFLVGPADPRAYDFLEADLGDDGTD